MQRHTSHHPSSQRLHYPNEAVADTVNAQAQLLTKRRNSDADNFHRQILRVGLCYRKLRLLVSLPDTVSLDYWRDLQKLSWQTLRYVPGEPAY
jgi:hypothetical protein